MQTDPDPELLRLLPCLSCRHPSAQAARDEIAQMYISARHGSMSLKATDGDIRPLRCCRRRAAQQIDAKVMVA